MEQKDKRGIEVGNLPQKLPDAAISQLDNVGNALG